MDDINTHGPTGGCPGCRAARRGQAYQYHTEECKKKFEKAMEEQAKVKAYKARMKEFEEREKQRQ
eukprot:1263725-Karenia_brevis.AAC.1